MKQPHSGPQGRARPSDHRPGENRAGGGGAPSRAAAGAERGAPRGPDAARLSLPRPPEPKPAPQRATGQRTRADLETPRGAVWLYGHHAVLAALANPNRRLRRLLLTEEAEAALAARRSGPWPLAPERAERGRIDNLLGRDAVHQGAALLADPLPVPPITTALERPGPILVLDQVSDPRNVGAILRTAAAFGAAAVIAQERNAPEETGALAKAASGALETVPLLRAVNIARTLIALKAAGCWTVGLVAGASPLSGPALADRRVAVVVGAEGEGIRRLVRETCDELAGIAMPGTAVSGAAVVGSAISGDGGPRGGPAGGGRAGDDSLDSLNVSAAAAIALYELNRRA